jgi:hypothetical protein
MSSRIRDKIRKLKREERRLWEEGAFSQEDVEKQNRINQRIQDLSEGSAVDPESIDVDDSPNASNRENETNTSDKTNKTNDGGRDRSQNVGNPQSNLQNTNEELKEQQLEIAGTDPGTPASELAQKYREKAEEVGEQENFSQGDVREQSFYNKLAREFEDREGRYQVDMQEGQAEIQRIAWQGADGELLNRQEALNAVESDQEQVKQAVNTFSEGQQRTNGSGQSQGLDNPITQEILDNAQDTGKTEQASQTENTDQFQKEGFIEKKTVGFDQSVQNVAKTGQKEFEEGISEAEERRDFRNAYIADDFNQGKLGDANVLGASGYGFANNLVNRPVETAASTVGNAAGAVAGAIDTALFSEEFQPGLIQDKNQSGNFSPAENFESTSERVSASKASDFEAVGKNPLSFGKFTGGSVGRIGSADAAILATGGDYNPGFNTAQGLASFAGSIKQQAEENPATLTTEVLFGFAGGKAGSTAVKAADVPDAQKNLVPTTQRQSETFGDNIGFADRVDPRTGFGRTPRPGEPTPESAIEQTQRFITGDLGERRMTSQELQQFDVVEGENIPDNPQGIPTTERTRTEVVNNFVDNVKPNSLEQLEQFGQTRKGQLMLEPPKSRSRTDDFDTTGRDLDGSTDVTTPEDRRTIERRNDFESRNRDVDRPRDSDREFNTPETPDLASGVGLGVGAATGLTPGEAEDFAEDLNQDIGQDNNQEFRQDDFIEEEFTNQRVQQQDFFNSRTQGQEQDFMDQFFTRENTGNSRRTPSPELGSEQDADQEAQNILEPDIGADTEGIFAASVSGIFSGETITKEEAEEQLEQGLTGFETRGLVIDNDDSNQGGGIEDLL